MCVWAVLYSDENLYKQLTENFDELSPTQLILKPTNAHGSLVELAAKIYNYYLGHDYNLSESASKYCDVRAVLYG